jgi:hypothetical protein
VSCGVERIELMPRLESVVQVVTILSATLRVPLERASLNLLAAIGVRHDVALR